MRKKTFTTRGGLGYVALDDAIELQHFQLLGISEYTEDERETRRQFLEDIDEIAEKYLNPKENIIYKLVIHERKRTSEVAIILNYNGWRTTQNSIERVFKILNLYSLYEEIDKEEFNKQLEENFTKVERKVIELAERRYTIQQISNKLGRKYHYTKTHRLIKGALKKLQSLEGAAAEYHDFLIEIRRFKDSCNFDVKQDKINFIGGEK
jgi:DNA-binding CsgD family transcriptional regulator